MNFEKIERRRDPRTQAFLPISLSIEGSDENTPAHLLDLSSGGAAVLMTAYDAPSLGQYIDLQFEVQNNNEDGEDPVLRRETGIVVNHRNPERGTARIGVRFIQHRDMNVELFDPLDVLSDHRSCCSKDLRADRWETARNFERFNSSAQMAN